MTSTTYDVIVLGGGGAGLSAALSAAEHGARTLLIESRRALGGSTAISIGSFTAAGTAWQRRRGIGDSASDFLADMARIPGVVPSEDNLELRELLAVEASYTLDWLHRIGIPFVGPFPEAPHRVPRMHNVVPDSRMYVARLSHAAKRAGVDFLIASKAVRLRRDAATGACTGVVVDAPQGVLSLDARRGVVVATGDFSGNDEMRREHLSSAAADAVPANAESSGDGHRLIRDFGGELRAMGVSTGPKLRFPAAGRRGLIARLPLWPPLMQLAAWVVQFVPPRALGIYVKSVLVVHMQPSPRLFESGAILVNLNGDRFCDETESTLSLAHEPQSTGYIVLDGTLAEQFSGPPNFISTAPGIAYAYLQDYARARPDLVHRASSAEELAERIEVDADSLQRALASAPRLGSSRLLALGPVVSTVTVTEGGAVVNTQCQVLRHDGIPIQGLYAAGGVAQGGMRLAGHGLHIAWATTSGRIAGAAAARRLETAVAGSVWTVTNETSVAGQIL